MCMKCKKILATMASLTMMISPMCVYADDTVYATDANGNSYNSIDSAWSAACNGTTVYMSADWNLNDRLVVPESTTVTIEMNGHQMNRNLENKTISDGEVLYLSKNSTLNLNGDDNNSTEFNIKGFNLSGSISNQTITSGGLVTGGSSDNGAGGIHMKKASTLVLDKVAIAGNSSTQISRYGGGININNDDCQLYMTDSKIAYNFAKTGGGIYVEGENEIITMDNSEICFNYAYESGGGINVYEDASYITMINGSKIYKNEAYGYGGGIYFNSPYCQLNSPDQTAEISDNCSKNYGGGGICVSESTRGNTQIIKNITFKSNSARESGGAIYTLQNNLTIENCIFEDNSAEDTGGAIYTNAKNTTIKNCTIQYNYAYENGGGIYVFHDVDLNVSGKVVVTDNEKYDGTTDNVYLDYSFWSGAYISGTPESGSSIGINCDDERKVGINQTEDNGSIFSDGDEFKITYKDGELYKESGSVLGSIFGNANLGVAVVVIVGIIAVGVIALIISKKKNHGKA